MVVFVSVPSGGILFEQIKQFSQHVFWICRLQLCLVANHSVSWSPPLDSLARKFTPIRIFNHLASTP
jgi:hypothetical protein